MGGSVSVSKDVAAKRQISSSVGPHKGDVNWGGGDELVTSKVFIEPTTHTLLEHQLASTHSADTVIINLPRGGVVVRTPAGYIQFGIPPETIKDSMSLGLEIPKTFVVLSELFDRELCLNIAEFEFPAYFNFFCFKRRVELVMESDLEDSIRSIFQEALLGPKPDMLDFTRDFKPGTPPSAYPNFVEEGFALDSDRTRITVDTLLNFVHIDHKGVAKLEDNVSLKSSPEGFKVRHGKELLATVPLKFKQGTHNVERQLKWDPFSIPQFGVTILGSSHGFDPTGTTTGFVVWVGNRGLMVDPPPNASRALEQMGIPARLVSGVLLTHCHADHDSGLFQKMLREGNMEVYTTTTIMNSFVRKYTAVMGFNERFIRNLFTFKPLLIGEPQAILGGMMDAFYSLHTVPTIGFTLEFNGQSMAYSGDTNADPRFSDALLRKGVVGEMRASSLAHSILEGSHHTLILHEAGVPPIHTPLELLEKLSNNVKARLFLVHVSAAMIPPNQGLNALSEWDTLRVDMPSDQSENISALQIMRSNTLLGALLGAPNSGTNDAVQRVLAAGATQEVMAGTNVITAGDTQDAVFAVMSGVAMESLQGSFNRYVVGDIIGAGGLTLGDVKEEGGDGVVANDAPPDDDTAAAEGVVSASVVAETKMVVYRIPISELKPMMANAPSETLAAARAEVKARRMAVWWHFENNVVLARLSNQQKLALLLDAREVTVGPGEHLFGVMQPILGAYIVVEGRLTFQYDAEWGDGVGATFRGRNKAKTYLREVLEPGGMVAPVNLMLERAESGADVTEPARAVNESEDTPAKLMLIHKANFVKFLEQYGGIKLRLLDSHVTTAESIG